MISMIISIDAISELTEDSEIRVFVRRNGKQEKVGVFYYDDLRRFRAVCEAICDSKCATKDED